MKPKTPLVWILAVLSVLPLLGTVAPGATITVLQTFDYPFLPNATATLPQKVSDQGVLVGTVMDSESNALGFNYKFRLGRFSAPIREPNDTGGVTQGRGINNRRHVVGEYLNGSDGTFHGYKLLFPVFAEIDVSGAIDTFPLGINNFGDVCGSVSLTGGTQPAYITVGHTTTMFSVPEASATFAYQLNASNEIIGSYIDVNGIPHGFKRDSLGNLTFPIDVTDAVGTFLFGNNDLNWGVGRFTDQSGFTHGLFFITSDNIQTFDYPGASFTSINGVNATGIACGYYLDEIGNAHGFIAKIDPNGTSKPASKLPLTPVKPAYLLPQIPGFVAPAL